MKESLNKMNQIMELGKSYEDYKIGEIQRYNGKHKIKVENVAEHSFMVALNIIKISKILEIKDNIRNKAVTMGILHDISEQYIGDVSYEFKSDEINKITLTQLFNQYEEVLYKNIYKDSIGEIYVDNDKVCLELVNLADAMAVLQYSTREITLGNSDSNMKFINEDAIKRVGSHYLKLVNIM